MSASGDARFLLRLPQGVYEALQEIAERERRSVNSQIVHVLERFVAENRQEDETEVKTAA